jgi:hypothetical protein
MAFLLVFASNRLDQRHFSTIQTTVNSVYKDRVVVQNIIYRLNNIVHQKELRYIRNDEVLGWESENLKVEQLLTDFEATELTIKESRLLNNFKDNFSALKALEARKDESSLGGISYKDGPAISKFREINKTLNGLTKIQLEQSDQLTQLSNKSLGMNILLSKLEIAFMIIIGITLMALVFYPTNFVKMTF